jgi:hypothetical protein
MSNPAPGTNISVEIEIVAAGASIEAHTAALAAKTCYVAAFACNDDTSPIRHIVGNFETQWRPNWDVDFQPSGGSLFIVMHQNDDG